MPKPLPSRPSRAHSHVSTHARTHARTNARRQAGSRQQAGRLVRPGPLEMSRQAARAWTRVWTRIRLRAGVRVRLTVDGMLARVEAGGPAPRLAPVAPLHQHVPHVLVEEEVVLRIPPPPLTQKNHRQKCAVARAAAPTPEHGPAPATPHNQALPPDMYAAGRESQRRRRVRIEPERGGDTDTPRPRWRSQAPPSTRRRRRGQRRRSWTRTHPANYRARKAASSGSLCLAWT